MTEISAPKPKSKLAIFGLFMLLIAFPGVSWYYLKKGFDYSKEVYAQTETKGHIDSLDITLVSRSFIADSLYKKAYLIVDKTRLQNEKNLSILRKQFNTNPNFIVLFQGVEKSKDVGQFAYAIGSDNMLSEIDPVNDMWLVDKKGNIRYKYNSGEDIWKNMARHLAFVVPKVRRNQLSIKRK